MSRITFLIFAAMVVGFLARGSRADGFYTGYADVMAGSVEAGQAVALQDPGGHDLVLNNVSATPITVDIQALVPSAAQVKEGMAPIPDLSWITFEPPVLHIAAHTQGTCKVLLKVPPERRYRRRWYQVMIWSRAHAEVTNGPSVAAGLLSRVRFYVVQPHSKPR